MLATAELLLGLVADLGRFSWVIAGLVGTPLAAGVLIGSANVAELVGAVTAGSRLEPLVSAGLDLVAALDDLRWRLADALLAASTPSAVDDDFARPLGLPALAAS